MKNLIIGLAVLIVIAVGAAIVVGNKNNDKQSSTNTSGSSTKSSKSDSYKVIKACEVLTPQIAQHVAGADATSSDAAPEASTESINVSNCNYYSVSSKTGVGLLARSAIDKTGAQSNEAQFTTQLPAGSQKVEGYGDAAYWSPSYGQLNILKSNNWYILSVGPANPSQHTLEQTEAYAKSIIDKL